MNKTRYSATEFGGNKPMNFRLSGTLSLFSTTIVRRYCSFKLEKKHLIPINGKKKFKRILVVGENFKLRKLPSKDLIALFSSRRRACLVLKHNRVSEVFKGFKVHDFEYYITVKEITF